MSETTVLSKATSKSDSIRTTVPMGIVKQFNLKIGDKLDWEIVAKDNKLAINLSVSRRRKGDAP